MSTSELAFDSPDMSNSFTAPRARCTVGIAGVSGACPLGFMYEDAWEIDERGQSNYPLCQPAIDALRPILEKLSDEVDFDTRAQCVCPFSDCRVTFVVHCPSNMARLKQLLNKG